MSEPTAYETVAIEKYLKECILDLAKLQWGHDYPRDHTWCVVMSGDGHAHIIVFDKPNSLESWMPRVSMTARESSTATLRALLATMEIELQANPNLPDIVLDQHLVRTPKRRRAS